MISHNDLMNYIEGHDAAKGFGSLNFRESPQDIKCEAGLRNRDDKEAAISLHVDKVQSCGEGGTGSSGGVRGVADKEAVENSFPRGHNGSQNENGLTMSTYSSGVFFGAGVSTDSGAKLHLEKPTTLDTKMKKVKPTFISPMVATKTKTSLSPRSQMLKELRFHKNKSKIIEVKPLGEQNNSSSNLMNDNKTSTELFFARKTKIEELPAPSHELSESGFNYTVASKKSVELCNSEESVTEQKADPKRKFTCDNCKKKYAYLQSLKSHQLKGQCYQKEFLCGQCEKRFKSNKCLRSHVITVHINPRFQCGDCLKIFPSQATVDAHLKHNHMKRECRFCSKLFKNSNTLRSHIHKEHKRRASGGQEKTPGTEAVESVGTASMKVCGPALKFKSKLLKTQSCPQKCSICGSVFHSRSGYLRHIKKHDKLGVSESECVGLNIELAPEDENIPDDA